MVDVNRNTKRQPHWQGKNPAQIPDAAPRSRTALDPVAYDNLIKQHGVRVKVYRSMFCPNVKSVDGGEHNIDCTLCNGSGYLDVDPIESVAYLSNQNFQEEMTVEGYHDGNTVGGTFLGGVELQYFTRVDLIDFTQPFYERVLRSEGNSSTRLGQVTVEFPETISTLFTLTEFAGLIGSSSFFNLISNNGATVTPTFFFFGDFNSGAPENTFSHDVAGGILEVIPAENPLTGEAWASSVVSLINSISTESTGTQFTPRNAPAGTIPQGAVVQRLCRAEIDISNPRRVIITQLREETTDISISREINGATGSIARQGRNDPTINSDHLKYDCKRVNVIIDKQGNQYYQDIDFVLTAQGNVLWIGGRRPATGSIYSVHYESVIQYRTITAMHVNRFAQVPDRTTGRVAQVKMPEQWMLQKEFLIKRRDEYGNEIKATGIFGDVIAAQPINPAPADTI